MKLRIELKNGMGVWLVLAAALLLAAAIWTAAVWGRSLTRAAASAGAQLLGADAQLLGTDAQLLGTDARSAASAAGVELATSDPLAATHQSIVERVIPAKVGGSASSASGKADAPVDFFDFGAIGSKAVVQHDFLLINRGSGPLNITRAYTTCGCTTAQISSAVIPAGKAARVTLTFDAGYHMTAGQTVRRGLVLETDDPDRPEMEIWVQAAVGR
jgi:hypothetical protein